MKQSADHSIFSRKQVTFLGAALLAVVALTVAPATLAEGREEATAYPLNPNLVTEAELRGIRGITDAMVDAVLKGRPFADMTAVHAAIGKGLSEEGRDLLYAQLFVPLNLNTASKEEILLVPGVGGRMAHEFDEYRPYKAMPQFHREIGKYVDDAELARLASFVFVPISLNTATDEQILAIPGVGKRMLHEFKEYRPYKSVEQFRREIGKYVDDGELARLERYVTLN